VVGRSQDREDVLEEVVLMQTAGDQLAY